jgi:tetratricopeptide (TPR) repeat protein
LTRDTQAQLGELEAARTSLQRALAIEEAVYGPEHPEVARMLGNLGNVQHELGKREAARTSLQRALAIFERFYGPDHADTSRARSSLERLSPVTSMGTGTRLSRLFRRRAR